MVLNEEILTERISGLKQDLRLKQRLNNRKCCRRERIKRERDRERENLIEKTSILKNSFLLNEPAKTSPFESF